MEKVLREINLLERRAADRSRLARLPVEDKLLMVALMQRRANAVRRAAGRPPRPEWPLELFRKRA